MTTIPKPANDPIANRVAWVVADQLAMENYEEEE